MTIAAVILATDAGDGFPSPKYATVVGGAPLIRTAVEQSMLWPVDERVVVLGADADDSIPLLSDLDVTVLVDPEWDEGQAAPIRAALDLVTRNRSLTHVMFVRGDQPGTPADVVAALVAHAAESDADMIAPKYRYERSWPIVVGIGLWSRLLGMEGTYDLQSLVAMHASTIEEVWFDRLAPIAYESYADVRRTTG